MNQPNYNFAYDAGGLVNYVWKNTFTQSNLPGQNSNSGTGITQPSGQTSQYQNQPNNSFSGNQNNFQECNHGNNNIVPSEKINEENR